MIKKQKLTEATKKLINDKNLAYKEMKINKSIENIIKLKNLSIISHKAIISDKRMNLKNKLEKNLDDPHKIWKTTTDKIYDKKLLLQIE